MQNISGKVAFVTGAGGGMGFRIASADIGEGIAHARAAIDSGNALDKLNELVRVSTE